MEHQAGEAAGDAAVAYAHANVEVVTSEQLRAWKAHPGKMRFFSFTHGKEFLVGPWVGNRRVTLTGLSGLAEIREVATGALAFGEAARVHVCRAKKCAYRYDNRVEPYLVHGRPVGLLPLDAPGEFAAAAAPAVEATAAAAAAEAAAADHSAMAAAAAADHESLAAAAATIEATAASVAEMAVVADGKTAEGSPSTAPPAEDAQKEVGAGVEATKESAAEEEEEEVVPDGKAAGASPSVVAHAEEVEKEAGASPAPAVEATAPSLAAEEADASAPPIAVAGEVSAVMAPLRPEHVDHVARWADTAATTDHPGHAEQDARGADPAAADVHVVPMRDHRARGADPPVVDLHVVPVEAASGEPCEALLGALSPAKRLALQACLREECVGMLRPYTDVANFVFFMYAWHAQERVLLHCGEQVTDVVAEWAPWALPAGEDLATWQARPGSHALCCEVAPDEEGEGRHLRWPATLTRCNHWHIAVESDCDIVGPHPPCAGGVCGDPAAPCIGLLAADLAAQGLVPLETACDGDCGIDVLLFWAGRERTKATKLEMRRWIQQFAEDHMHDDSFLVTFDSLVLPDWSSKVERMALDLAPSEKTGEERPVPRAREDLGLELDDATEAVFWALSDVRHVEEGELAKLAAAMSEEDKAYWVEAWKAQRNVAKPARPARVAKERGRNRSYNVPLLRQSAEVFVRQFKASGAEKVPRNAVVKFLKSRGWVVDKKMRMAFKRIVDKLQGAETTALAGRSLCRRKRLWGKQGSHLVKAPALREALFGWFCEVRGRCKGRLPLFVMDLKAQLLRRQYMQEALRLHTRPRAPVISKSWLYRFRKEYCISLRHPNRRWKVPRQVLLDRLRIMWANTIRLRTLALVLLKYDLTADGFDQKPFHKNEAGSKGQKTLSMKGVSEVAIKELIDATRDRWTANTWVTSRPATALAGPPLEVLFKGGDGVEESLRQCIESGGYQSLTSQVSNSGSYRNAHVLTYLERVLPSSRRGPEDNEWRLLYCDRYRAHEGDALRRLCWAHKYVLLFHGGGTTGVAQVNDTHLHAPLSKAYQELEMHESFVQMALNPDGLPKRSRDACVADIASVWRRTDLHLTALAGWKANMIMNCLDGSEDQLASSEIRGFWEELRMDNVRQEIIEDVCRECEAGRLEWSMEVVYDLIEDFKDTGHVDWYEEGQEDEGALVGEEELGEVAWKDFDCPSPEEDENLDPFISHRTALAGENLEEELDEDQRAEVERQAGRLKALKDAEAVVPPDARLQKVFSQVRRSWDREATGKSQVEAKIARAIRAKEVLRKDATEQLDRELKRRRQEREAQSAAIAETCQKLEAAQKEMRRQEKALEAAGRKRAEVAAAEKRRAALAAVATGFTVGELGQGQRRGGGERFRRARMDLVARVAMLGDALPLHIEARFEQWRRRFDEQGCLQHGAAWGSVLRDQINQVVSALMDGHSGAFLRWQAVWTRRWFLDRDEVVVPGAAASSAP